MDFFASKSLVALLASLIKTMLQARSNLLCITEGHLDKEMCNSAAYIL